MGKRGTVYTYEKEHARTRIHSICVESVAMKDHAGTPAACSRKEVL